MGSCITMAISRPRTVSHSFFGLERRKAAGRSRGGVVVDAAAGDAAVRVQKAHKAFGEHTFAAAALAHKGRTAPR